MFAVAGGGDTKLQILHKFLNSNKALIYYVTFWGPKRTINKLVQTIWYI